MSRFSAKMFINRDKLYCKKQQKAQFKTASTASGSNSTGLDRSDCCYKLPRNISVIFCAFDLITQIFTNKAKKSGRAVYKSYIWHY